ncbi:efflux RND transporter periplasmic adaptor subunit [Hydrogenimonas cancrithermarum]|uniref:Multidrug resistance protein MdtA-like barrel-sandwich hybrid domain-containing protein n=1 Tax=Hydrogenimonas cancrithermarum TaxID=2993563 RepID=A0ABN6WTB6_9BACT|nr:efflux RND transporter periplasmic adaptor subunit [Hydrogenimonas cancrithermarum]BDY12304.1 hypothetical protein HCR_06160 [Hydrogenimonas cancrithermarum]
MKRLYLIVAIAMLGLVFTGLLVYKDSAPLRGRSKPIPTWHPPFASFVAGTGIVEASSTNISVGSPVSGIVEKLYVKPGSLVRRGEPLFKLDDRKLRAKLPLLESEVTAAKSEMKKYRDIFEIDEKLYREAPGTISQKDYEISRNNYRHAMDLWKKAKANLKVLKDEIALYTVMSPIKGRVLQCRMREGTYMQASGGIPPLLILGSRDLHLRVEVDEYEAWRIKAKAKAVAFVRGHPDMKLTLKYLYTEPLIVPKSIIQERPTERTDTRVLQVIYRFEHPDFPIYPGQTLDVFIETAGNS